MVGIRNLKWELLRKLGYSREEIKDTHMYAFFSQTNKSEVKQRLTYIGRLTAYHMYM